MVGLNHEFARELLWREYPTDQRGSYFRQFWDVRGFLAPERRRRTSARERLRDIPPLHVAARLRARRPRPPRGRRRRRGGGRARDPRRAAEEVPDTRSSTPTAREWRAQRGRQRSTPTPERRSSTLTAAEEADPPRTKVRTPLYEAKVDPDIYFFGFDLTAPEATRRTGETDDRRPGLVLRDPGAAGRAALRARHRARQGRSTSGTTWPGRDVAAASGTCSSRSAPRSTSPPLVEPTERRPPRRCRSGRRTGSGVEPGHDGRRRRLRPLPGAGPCRGARAGDAAVSAPACRGAHDAMRAAAAAERPHARPPPRAPRRSTAPRRARGAVRRADRQRPRGRRAARAADAAIAEAEEARPRRATRRAGPHRRGRRPARVRRARRSPQGGSRLYDACPSC